jgi:arginine decarboxylase
MTNERTPALVEALRAYYEGEVASFHMPGHKQRGGTHPATVEVFGPQILRADVCEMGGFDYLHSPTGALVEAQERAAYGFGAAKTYFLVNGSTGGNLSAISALTREGDHVLMLRGSHRSVYTAIALSGAAAHYIPLAHDEREHGEFLATPPNVKDLPSKLAVIHITRPNYYGMACDLGPYVDIARHTGAMLIVDEAHGSHFGFNADLPESALQQGADIVIQSTHKTLGALTQASMLHLGPRALAYDARIQRSLAMLQSSSPSVLLSLSLDLAAEHMQPYGAGRDQLGQAVRYANGIRAAVENLRGLRVVQPAGACDPTKVVIDVTGAGYSGFSAAAWLQTNARIYVELADFRRIVCCITMGDTTDTIEILLAALRSLSKCEGSTTISNDMRLPAIPSAALTQRAATQSQTEMVPIANATNHTCAEYVIPYPPGIPLVVPGEILTAETLQALRAFRLAGSKVVGPHDQSGETILVIRD